MKTVKRRDIWALQESIATQEEIQLKEVSEHECVSFDMFSREIRRKYQSLPFKPKLLGQRVCFFSRGLDTCKYKAFFKSKVMGIGALTKSEDIIAFNTFKATHLVLDRDVVEEFIKLRVSSISMLTFKQITVIGHADLPERTKTLLTSCLKNQDERRLSVVVNKSDDYET